MQVGKQLLGKWIAQYEQEWEMAMPRRGKPGARQAESGGELGKLKPLVTAGRGRTLERDRCLGRSRFSAVARAARGEPPPLCSESALLTQGFLWLGLFGHFSEGLCPGWWGGLRKSDWGHGN